MRRANERRNRRGAIGICLHLDQILDEDEPQHVVERFLVYRHARILLFAKQRVQLIDRCIRLDGHDVGPGRHHFANHGLAEVNERAQQLARLPFLRGLHFRRDGSLGSGGGRLGIPIPIRRAAFLRPAGTHANQRRGERPQQFGHDIERRQQKIQHAFRILPHDQQRNQVLAREDDANHRKDQQRKAGRIDARDPGEKRHPHNRECGDQDAHRNEQPARILQVPSQRIIAVGALGVDAQREPHQRVEGRCDGAEVGHGAADQEQQERCHSALGERRRASTRIEGPPRSINPTGSPAFRRKRASTRAILPSSVS